MSQASFPRRVSRPRAAAVGVALLFIVAFAASPPFALALFRTPQKPQQKEKIPAEQLPPRQKVEQTKPPGQTRPAEQQKPPQAPVCPVISVECPPKSDTGRPLYFTARLTRKGPPARKEDYRWTVYPTNNAILKRDRDGDTHIILVATDKLDGESVRVTFEVAGYGPGCTKSCETFVAQRPTPTPTTKQVQTPSPSPRLTPTPTQTTPTPTPTPTPGTSPSPTPPAPLPSAPPPAGVPTSPSASPSSSATDTTNDAGLIRRFWPLLLLLLALLAAAAAFLVTRQTATRKAPAAAAGREFGGAADVDSSKAMFVMGGTKKVADELHCTVFAPHECAPGDGVLVQAFAHLAEHAPLLAALAKEADRDAARRGADKLGAIERGQELFFHLNMPGLEVDEPLQSIVWNGDIESVQFGVQVPEAFGPRRINCKLTVSVAGVPVGHVRFVFEVVAAARQDAAAAPPDPAGKYVRYRKGFVSYASEDLAEVLKRVQVMTQLGIDCFQDLLSLKPGERWERKLYLRIDESDVFFLFWSEAARKSEWVEREVRYALGRKGEDEGSPPEIMPVILEGPPRVPPPSYLPEQHFNDPFALLIRAVGPPTQGPKEV